MPEFEISAKEKSRLDFRGDFSQFGYLAALTRNGFKERNCSRDEVYINRIKEELEVINNLHFAPYFILVIKLVEWARENGLLVGPGRGSAVSSLVLYLNNVTQLDPIRHDLLFERFLSADRTETKEVDGVTLIKSDMLPDIDLDFEPSKREKLDIFFEEYFKGRYVSIANYARLTTKILIKDVLKVSYGFSEGNAAKLSGLVDTKFGKLDSLKESFSKNKALRDFSKENVSFEKTCYDLENLMRGKSVHAGGLALLNEDANLTIPLEKTKDGLMVSALNKDDVANFGIKLDKLAIAVLDIIRKACEFLGITDYYEFDVDDPSIFEFLNSKDEFLGLFQLEQKMGFNVCKRVKPQSFEDLMFINAVGRPGAYEYLDEYLEREKYEGDPRLNDILGVTKGIIVYQEQSIALTKRMAGFSGQDADKVRKAIGKKLSDLMAKYKSPFFEGAKKNGYDEQLIEDIWSSFEGSANYSFNRSHCASYSLLTARTVHLKANHPVEFYTALLQVISQSTKQDKYQKIADICREAIKLGVDVLPPSIVNGSADFNLEDNSIRFGLSGISGITNDSCKLFDSFKTLPKNEIRFFQLCKELGIRINVILSLIEIGAVDELTDNRFDLLLAAKTYNKMTKNQWEKVVAAEDRYKTVFEAIKGLSDEGLLTDKAVNGLKEKIKEDLVLYKRQKAKPDLFKFAYEKKHLGFSFSCPSKKLFDTDAAGKAKEKCNGENFRVLGFVEKVDGGKSKAGNLWARLKVTDERDTIECVSFGEKSRPIRKIEVGSMVKLLLERQGKNSIIAAVEEVELIS